MSELMKIEKGAFVAKYEPLKMITEYKHIKTVAEAVKSDENSLSVYSKHLGADTVLAVIELHLLALNNSVNVQRELSKFQIKEIAVEIQAQHYYLNMVEVAYVFRRAKRGEYGKLYGALNMVDILDWFSQYAEERVQHFINKSTADRHNDHSMRSEERKIWERHEKLVNKNRPK